jgi:glycosyltransferase involved in cell wall biosynthesis
VLAILTTHPIQYQVPIWQELARQGRIDFEVWYLSRQGVTQARDPGFDRIFQWDLDLLEGYPYRFLDTVPNPADIFTFRGARIASLPSLLRDHEVSALWINGWQVEAYWQAAFHAHRAQIPVWLRAESNDLHLPSRLKRWPRRVLLHHIFRRIDRFLYIGSANRRLYQSFGVPEAKLLPAPYCVDNERFVRSAGSYRPERLSYRRRWGVADEAVCFLFAGKFIRKKRPLDILDAAIALVREEPFLAARFHLLLVGDGELRLQLEARAAVLASLCGRPVVSFLGFLNQTEIAPAYVAADWLILASDADETWGLVVNEALACGTPSLVSDLCGCAEDLARPLSSDMEFPCGDVQALTERLHAVVTGDLPAPEPDACESLLATYSIQTTVCTVTAEFAGLRNGAGHRLMPSTD